MEATGRERQPWKKRTYSSSAGPTAEFVERILEPKDPLTEMMTTMAVKSPDDIIEQQLKRKRAEQRVLFARRDKPKVRYDVILNQLKTGQVPDLPAPTPAPEEQPVEVVPEFMPPNVFGIVMRHPFDLYPHQIHAVNWIREREAQPKHGIQGGVLSLEMGLGKTLISLNLILSDYREGQCATLCVMPKGLMTNYLMDIGKFFGKTVRALIWDQDVLSKAFFQFSEQTPFKNHIVIVSYDTVLSLAKSINILNKGADGSKKLQDVAAKFFKVQWYRVLCDESHRLANPKTLLWQSMMHIKAPRRVCMSGTVVRNYEKDIFGQLAFCGLNVTDQRLWIIQTYERLGLKERVLSMSLQDSGIKLPEKQHDIMYIDLSPMEQQVHEIIMAKSREQYGAYKRKDTHFASVLEMIVRLRQVCIACHLITPQSKTKKLTDKEQLRNEDGIILGANYVQLEHRIRSPEGESGYESGKLKTILKIAEAVPENEKVIIYSEWSAAIHLIATMLIKRFGETAVLCVDGEERQRDAVFARFRCDPAARILVMTKVGSVGLTLIEANHIILTEPTYTSTDLEQAVARIHRIGQTKKCFVYQLIMKNSIETELMRIMSEKRDIRDALLDTGIDASVLDKLFG